MDCKAGKIILNEEKEEEEQTRRGREGEFAKRWRRCEVCGEGVERRGRKCEG